MHIKHIHSCRACGNPNLVDLINLGEHLSQGCFRKDGITPPITRKTPNKLVRCDTTKCEHACGLVQMAHSVPPEILYANYWYESSISDTMTQHLKNIAQVGMDYSNAGLNLVVLDIASNDNTLLQHYPAYFKRYGIDPSDIARKQINNKDGITVFNETFPSRNLRKCIPQNSVDIITSIACFYDVDRPIEFAHEVANLLRPRGIWIFEVAYLKSIIENLSYDSIVNEHVVHYSLATIEYVLKQAGLKVFRAHVTPTNGGSILCYATHEDCDSFDNNTSRKEMTELRIKEFEARLDDDWTYQMFACRVNEHRNSLRSLILSLIEKGNIIHVYGASTKLNTILSYCDLGPPQIQFAAERSPNKIGGSTLSGIKMISEEESRAMKPNYYLVGPYHFKEEILKREKETMSNGIQFIFPLPEITIH